MAIQMRRGAYGDLDPTKAVNAEVLVVTSNDPIATDGKAVYVAFAPGSVKRYVSREELESYYGNQASEAVNICREYAESAEASAEAAAQIGDYARQAAEDVAEIEGYAETVGRVAEAAESEIAEIREAKTAAQTAASNASTSASNASGSATAAASSETNASASASSANTYASTAKSWAVGPNGSGSGTSTNNSKYYSQQAAGEATSAKSWAVGPSGTGSGTDTNNAKYYSQQAAASASTAASEAAAASQAAVEGFLDTVLGNFATVESSTTASKAYKVGEYLILNNLLYRVTAAIASGGTITPGTNCAQTTVGDEVSNNVLWWSSQAIASTSGASGTLLTITDSRITADHVLDKFMPSNPSAITSDVTCTTSAGQAILTGVSTSAITAEIMLMKKDN